MREILFRGKRKDNGEWIEGIPIKTYDTEIGMDLPLRYKPKNITLMNNDRVELYCSMYESAYFDTENYPIIDDETIGQYTGLTDKNGVKIFEGDILEGDLEDNLDPGAKWRSEVIWGKFGWMCKGRQTLPMDEYDILEGEVVGNIHDNPELLKGSAENE